MPAKISQDKLSKDAKRDLRWGSHVPLNQSILSSIPITGVLELGAGTNSTPLFFEKCEYVTSVESDKHWINKLINDQIVKETENCRLVYHSVPDSINRSTLRKDISKDVLDSAIELYTSLITPQTNFLFVDCYAGFRLEALEKLHEKFDVIVYDDVEPENEWCYSYDSFNPNEKYIRLVDKTFLTHVGLLVSNKYEHLIDNLKASFEVNSKNFANKFNAKHTPALNRC